jgi:hypothetical protein
MRARFQVASRQGHHALARRAGRQRSQYLQGVRTCIYIATSALWTTGLAPLQCQVTRQQDVILLTECNMADDKTRRVHIIEDIIHYS